MSGPGSQAERHEWLQHPGRRRCHGAALGRDGGDGFREDDMRLAVTFLGLDLFSIDLTTAEADDDYSRDLSGGTLGSDSIEAGGDCFMGFTNGRGDDE